MRREIKILSELPQRTEDTWQAAVVQLPVGPEGDDGLRQRVSVGLCVSKEMEIARVGSLVLEGEVRSVDLILEATEALAVDADMGYRPGTIEVNDDALASHLSKELVPAGVHVESRTCLELIDECAAYLLKGILSELNVDRQEGFPGYLDGEGVTVEQLRSFTDAADAFVRSSVWQGLGRDDLLEISQPDAPEGMRYASFLVGHNLYAVLLFPTEERFWRFRDSTDPKEALECWRGLWHVGFLEREGLPPADRELWQKHAFPVAHAEGYPSAAYMAPTSDSGPERPNAGQLAFLEGLLRALTASSDEELDAGRWVKEVTTGTGKLNYELKLPLLLDPLGREELYERGIFDRRALEAMHAQVGRFLDGKQLHSLEEVNEAIQQEFGGEEVDLGKHKPRTKLEEAQDLCYEAFSSMGRRRLALARQALRTHPDCADGYVLLAEAAWTAEEAVELYEKAVEAGKRSLGEGFREEFEGRFWSAVETRPFMRALEGLAHEQLGVGREEEGLANLQELQRLNPNDNQGVRYQLLPRLIACGRLSEAEELLGYYEDDAMALWHYCRALLSFSRSGDTPATKRLLKEALAANPLVPTFLLGEREPPEDFDTYQLGSEEEAAICADECALAWGSVPGALEWLERGTTPSKGKGAKGGR